MIAWDIEFTVMYLLYGLAFIGLSLGWFLKKSRAFRVHFIIYGCYTTFMIWLFLDPVNFKYGSSLVILYYGILFILVHLVGAIVYKLFRHFVVN